jgi:hypothetical protein
MAGQARDLRVVAGCESPLIITARACPAPPRPTGAGSKRRLPQADQDFLAESLQLHNDSGPVAAVAGRRSAPLRYRHRRRRVCGTTRCPNGGGFPAGRPVRRGGRYQAEAVGEVGGDGLQALVKLVRTRCGVELGARWLQQQREPAQPVGGFQVGRYRAPHPQGHGDGQRALEELTQAGREGESDLRPVSTAAGGCRRRRDTNPSGGRRDTRCREAGDLEHAGRDQFGQVREAGLRHQLAHHDPGDRQAHLDRGQQHRQPVRQRRHRGAQHIAQPFEVDLAGQADLAGRAAVDSVLRHGKDAGHGHAGGAHHHPGPR